MRLHILIADDHPDDTGELEAALRQYDAEVSCVADGQAAHEMVQSGKVDALVSELVLPGLGGKELIHKILAEYPTFPVFIRTRYGNLDDAFELARLGAVAFNLKQEDNLESFVEDTISRLNRRSGPENQDQEYDSGLPFSQYRSQNAELASIFKTAIERVAKAPSTVLITGESGTGKELLAKTIHYYSQRNDKPWIAVHCAALPENLIESELFGHEKGAFTGANARRIGRFEQADTGTFFLDEVSDLSTVVQTKLLRVLQERTFERVGGNKPISVDVRIIAATNRNLKEMVKAGDFREDLFFRLSVIDLELPPLRNRPEDIPGMAQFFVERFRRKMGREEMVLTPRSLQTLQLYSWPGNVRELENVLEKAVVLTPASRIELEDFPREIQKAGPSPQESITLRDAKARFEKQFVIRTLQQSGGNVSASARILGIARKNLQEKINKYDIDLESIRSEAGE